MRAVKLLLGLLVMFAVMPFALLLFADVIKIAWAGVPIWVQVAIVIGVVTIGARIAWGFYRWLTRPFRAEK